MGPIDRYVFRDADGDLEEFATFDADEAQRHARENGLTVCCEEYEYSETTFVADWDFAGMLTPSLGVYETRWERAERVAKLLHDSVQPVTFRHDGPGMEWLCDVAASIEQLIADGTLGDDEACTVEADGVSTYGGGHNSEVVAELGLGGFDPQDAGAAPDGPRDADELNGLRLYLAAKQIFEAVNEQRKEGA